MTISIVPSKPDNWNFSASLAPKIMKETRYSERSLSLEKLKVIYEYQWIPPAATKVFYVMSTDQKDPVGLGAFCIGADWFGNAETASDLIVYIDPKYRGGRGFIKLIKAYEEWARSRGAVELVLSVSTGINTQKTGQLYERLGYKLNILRFTKE